MESNNMGINGDLKDVSLLLDLYANSTEGRLAIINDLLTSDPLDLRTPEKVLGSGNNKKILNSYIKSAGFEITRDDNEEKTDLMKFIEEADRRVLHIIGKFMEENPVNPKLEDLQNYLDIFSIEDVEENEEETLITE